MGQWVPVREAAQILGISEKTIKRRIAGGQMEARTEHMEKGLRYLVEVPEGTPEIDAVGQTEAANGVTLAYQQLVESLQDQVNHLQQELTFKNREIVEFHRILGQQSDQKLIQPPVMTDLVPVLSPGSTAGATPTPHRGDRKMGFLKRLFGTLG